MLTAANEKTRMIQEVTATAQGELLGAERAAQVAFVDALNPMPLTGPCRCLGIMLFGGEVENANLRVMDGGRSVPLMEIFSSSGWWDSFIMPRGVASSGNLVITIGGTGAYGYVYYLPE